MVGIEVCWLRAKFLARKADKAPKNLSDKEIGWQRIEEKLTSDLNEETKI